MALPEEFTKPESLRTLGNYLRGSNGVKSKQASQHDKRVDYFRGSRLLECLLETDESKPLSKWPKTLPKIRDIDVAINVAQLLIQNDYFHRSEKVPGKRKYLMVSKNNIFEESGHYTWMYEGSMMWSNIATTVLIAAVIGFTMMPIWPTFAKKGLWWLSVTFLIFTIGFFAVRFILFTIIWIFGYEFWIYPNLLDESLSFFDSFKPAWALAKSGEGQGYYRLGLVGGMIGFVFWVMTQPTEFDTFLQGQKHFLDDLYNGNLLADAAAVVAEQRKAKVMEKIRIIPKLEELLADEEGEPTRPIRAEPSDTYGEDDVAAMMAQMQAGEEQADKDMDAMLEELTRLEEVDEIAAVAEALEATESGDDADA